MVVIFFSPLSGKYILMYTHKFEKSGVALVVVVVHPQQFLPF